MRLGKRSRKRSLTDRGEDRRARAQADERRQVGHLAGGLHLIEGLDQRAPHGVADDQHGVDAVLLDQAPHLAGVELLHEHADVALEELHEAAREGGAVHERRRVEEHELATGLGRPLGVVVLGRHLLVGEEVRTAHERVEDVLGPPHDALGHAGRAAGVDDHDVVGRPRAEVPLGRTRGEGIGIGDGVEAVLGRARPVGDHDQRAQHRHVADDGGDAGPELLAVDEADQIGVVEEVAQLLLDVAVVDVDGHGADLEDGEHRLHPLDAVGRVDADVLARLDAVGGEVVGEAVGPLLELAEGADIVAADEGGLVGDDVGGVLEEIGEVVGHGAK